MIADIKVVGSSGHGAVVMTAVVLRL